MIKGLTSVIVVGYHKTAISAHMTMACLANITKYTDTEDYELILIEDVPEFKVRDDYHVLKIDKHIILKKYTNYSTKMNLAAKKAKGEFIAFVQNDVFVWEGWLKGLRYYLENGLGDAIIPSQFPSTRQHILDTYTQTYEEGLNGGTRDACMIMITREAFDKTGGFDDNLQVFVEKDFYQRMSDAGINQITTSKVDITHITLGTHYQDMDAMDKKMHHDSLIQNNGVNPDDIKE